MGIKREQSGKKSRKVGQEWEQSGKNGKKNTKVGQEWEKIKETISSLPLWPKLAVLKPSPVYPYSLCGRLETISSLSLEPFLVHVGCLETISGLSLAPSWLS